MACSAYGGEERRIQGTASPRESGPRGSARLDAAKTAVRITTRSDSLQPYVVLTSGLRCGLTFCRPLHERAIAFYLQARQPLLATR